MAKRRSIQIPSSQNSSRIKGAGSNLPNPFDMHPVFCLQHLQNNYNIDACDNNQRTALLKKLHNLCQSTWKQIFNNHRQALGFEKLEWNAIKAPIPNYVTEDAEFICFRFHGDGRMVGYKEDRIFHILWLDGSCRLYDHY